MSDIPAKPAEHEVEKGDWVPFGLAAIFMFRFIRYALPRPMPAPSCRLRPRMLARLWLEGRVLTGSCNAPHTADLRESSGLAMLTRHEVQSTSIRAIGYDPDRCEVWVEYINRSGPYVYFDVPAEVYAGLEQADRKGPYVNLVIKQYRYEYRGRWPDDGARSDSHEGRVGGFRVPG